MAALLATFAAMTGQGPRGTKVMNVSVARYPKRG